MENTNRIVRPTSQEQRGGKRSEITADEREVRATIPESRGRKSVSENDGRIDLDEADLEKARNAAEAGLEILRKSVRVDTVTPATYSYYAPMPVRSPPPPPRWCDVDDEMENDPFVNLENGKLEFRKTRQTMLLGKVRI